MKCMLPNHPHVQSQHKSAITTPRSPECFFFFFGGGGEGRESASALQQLQVVASCCTVLSNRSDSSSCKRLRIALDTFFFLF